MKHNLRSMKSVRRPGYTLIEMLVVIAIIGVLASLGAWGIFAVIGTRQKSNTEATIRVVTKLMQDRWSKVIAEAKKEKLPDSSTPQGVNLRNLSGINAGLDPRGERTQVIWVKIRLAEAWPQSFAELHPTNATIVNTFIPANRRKPHFAKYQTAVQAVYPTFVSVDPTKESSTLLLMALNALQNTDGVRVEDQLGYAVADTNGDGLKELVDAWGVPLFFFRYPINNTVLQAANPAAAGARGLIYADPIDTGGSLINKAWYNPIPPPPLSPAGVFDSQFHQAGFIDPFGTRKAFYTTPTIVSAGMDGQLDLVWPTMGTIGPGTGDNIYSFQLRGD